MLANSNDINNLYQNLMSNRAGAMEKRCNSGRYKFDRHNG
jgi:hypothetical protein